MLLFDLIRSALTDTKLTDAAREAFSPDVQAQMTALAKKHDIAHLLFLGLQKNELIEAATADQYLFQAVYRYERLKYDYENLCAKLESEGIAFLPLKGSVLRDYYPQPWMRTSCDVDVLIHEEDLDRARSLLVDGCGYVYKGTGSHDISLFTPAGVHVELHYDLVEDGRANRSSRILGGVWEMATVREGFSHWYEMPDDLYYFYHVAHMAKHFEDGGCGIRPLIDLWILDHPASADRKRRDALLAKGDLLKFADSARRLSRVWFEDCEHDPITRQMENYILRGGVYGTQMNRVIVHQQRKGGRIRYALSKIFLPYDLIKYHYPILQKHRWLTPFMQVRRWCKLIFCGHLRRSARELQYNGRISSDDAARMQTFLENIGL